MDDDDEGDETVDGDESYDWCRLFFCDACVGLALAIGLDATV